MSNFFSFVFGGLAFMHLISHDNDYQLIAAYVIAAVLFAMWDIAAAAREKNRHE